jgi:Cu(I)/Ag(I) efflux system membrane fusion protein
VSGAFDAIGAVQFDERRNVAVQTRVAGYVERLVVRAPMERVRKGQALATVFAPDWIGPQNELIALKRSGVSKDIVAAARARLRALSVPDDLVRRSEDAGTAQARFTLVSPEDGVVAELGVREGMAVTPGVTLFGSQACRPSGRSPRCPRRRRRVSCAARRSRRRCRRMRHRRSKAS